jgi:ArsR family transcriptional regulator
MKHDRSSNNPKRAVFAGLAVMAQALANAYRIEIVELLGQGERTVEQVAQRLGLLFANASQHLRLMRQAGLLISRREGKNVYYGLRDPGVVDLLAGLGRLAEQNLADVRQVMADYFHERDALEPVSREELAARMRDGAVTVLDVRPEDEFAMGRLPGAVNIPLSAIEQRLAELPVDREIVAYCRGPYCVLSFEAAALLRSRGYSIRRLEDGFPEWKAAGLPIEATA